MSRRSSSLEEPLETSPSPEDPPASPGEPKPRVGGIPPETSLTGIVRTSKASTLLNLLVALIGPGLVNAPATFKYCGVGLTMFLLILSGILNHIGGVIIIKFQRKFETRSIESLSWRFFGKIGLYATSFFIIFFNLTRNLANVIIGTYQLDAILQACGLHIQNWQLRVTIYYVIFCFPLSFIKKMSEFAKLSSIALVSVFVYAIIISGRSISKMIRNIPESVQGMTISFNLFSAFAVHSLTFSLPIIMTPILIPSNPSTKRRTFLLGITYLVTWVVTSIPAVLAYLSFGNDVKSDILMNYAYDDGLIIVVRLAILIVMTPSIPMTCYNIVGSLSYLIWKKVIPEKLENKQRLTLLIIVDVVTYLLCLCFKDIQMILSIGGSLGACVVSYMLPSAFHLRMTKEKWTSPKNIGMIIFFIFGGITTLLGVISGIRDAALN